jgi:hypothetical protein
MFMLGFKFKNLNSNSWIIQYIDKLKLKLKMINTQSLVIKHDEIFFNSIKIHYY